MTRRLTVLKSLNGIEIIKLADRLEVYHRGPGIDEGPLPTLIYLALSGEESLNLEPINQPAVAFARERVRVISMTLPAHGPGFDPVKAMYAWAKAMENGENILENFLKSAEERLGFLIEADVIDSNRLAIAGLSRGGFLAMHLAARVNPISTVLGFAPLTQLEFLEEFKSAAWPSNLWDHDLLKVLPNLIYKRVRFYIGNHDTRVGTEAAFNCIKGLADFAYSQGMRSSDAELIITSSIGHKGHGTSPATFNEGIEWLRNVWKLKEETV